MEKKGQQKHRSMAKSPQNWRVSEFCSRNWREIPGSELPFYVDQVGGWPQGFSEMPRFGWWAFFGLWLGTHDLEFATLEFFLNDEHSLRTFSFAVLRSNFFEERQWNIVVFNSFYWLRYMFPRNKKFGRILEKRPRCIILGCIDRQVVTCEFKHSVTDWPL